MLHLVTTPATPGDGVATLIPGPDFAYLSPAAAEIFLTQIGQNERGGGSQSLGVLVPRDVDVLSDKVWAVIHDYSDDGCVCDADAFGGDKGETLND